MLTCYVPKSGDLVKYMSRTLLVIDKPYPISFGQGEELWVETIEIDENTCFPIVHCEYLAEQNSHSMNSDNKASIYLLVLSNLLFVNKILSLHQ